MRKQFFLTALFSFLIGVIAGLIFLFLTKPNAPTVPASQSQLKNVVDGALVGSKGTYGLVVTNLKTGETYSVNPDRRFNSASLYKLWVMATAYDQIAKGNLDKDEVLSRDVAALNSNFNIATDEAELAEGTITMTVGEALNQMIAISHNYAALLLSERVGLKNITAFLTDHGLRQSQLGEPPQTTAADTARFFVKLYRGELANQTYTDEMVVVLKAQTFNDKIPRGLPDEVPVAHKTGEVDYFSHDGGIVFGRKSDYVIVVLSESDFPPGAEERIATISQAVYEYFE
ncbi:serine hydrolase [Candidatus Microgenomates bacterium]|nr:serine hydrolase [Candidatus Microgenomates bacterium]